MKVWLNGDPLEVRDTTTVADLVQGHAASTKGVAVAVDEQVVPRSEWPARQLADGQRVEILVAAQGG